MRRLLPLVLLAACEGDETVGAPIDARVSMDVFDAYMFPPPNDLSMCTPTNGSVSCVGGSTMGSTMFRGGYTSLTMCGLSSVSHDAVCSAGCVLETSLSMPYDSVELSPIVARPEILCAETDVARAGDSCAEIHYPARPATVTSDFNNQRACLPTRARLNADGTVAGQDYLRCENGTCTATTAPTIPNYLGACDAGTVAQYGTADVTGAVLIPSSPPPIAPYSPGNRPWACLITWDASAQVAKSGVTFACIGDWQCPDQALCDDQVPVLAPAGTKLGVCKPGPRGMLTPAMLAD